MSRTSILAWGREMLRNYRPDQISTSDYRWRYVEAVKTEVKYGSQDVKNDLPTLQSYQNIIMNGGVCGRRAFFGRFILRCFGIPTVARPQPGHATLVHWTPDGWVICLGAGWGAGRIEDNSDLDFLAMTQAQEGWRRPTCRCCAPSGWATSWARSGLSDSTPALPASGTAWRSTGSGRLLKRPRRWRWPRSARTSARRMNPRRRKSSKQ